MGWAPVKVACSVPDSVAARCRAVRPGFPLRDLAILPTAWTVAHPILHQIRADVSPTFWVYHNCPCSISRSLATEAIRQTTDTPTRPRADLQKQCSREECRLANGVLSPAHAAQVVNFSENLFRSFFQNDLYCQVLRVSLYLGFFYLNCFIYLSVYKQSKMNKGNNVCHELDFFLILISYSINR